VSRVLAPMLKRYIKKVYKLDPNLYPNRVIEEDLSKNRIDGIYIDFLNTTANLNNIDFSVDESDWFPASLGQAGIEIHGYAVYRLRIRWLSSEDGKQLVLLYAGEQRIRFTVALQTVSIVRDDVGLAKDATVANVKNLDVALSVLYKLIKFNRNVTPVWVYGSEVTAPAANTSLVSKTVSTGRTGYVYGIFISAGEANDFKLNWTSGGVAYSIRIPFSSKGAVQVVFDVPANEGLPADAGSTISIVNVNAGSTGVVYQAGFLYAEV